MILKLHETTGAELVIESKRIVHLIIPSSSGSIAPSHCDIVTSDERQFQIEYAEAPLIEAQMRADNP